MSNTTRLYRIADMCYRVSCESFPKSWNDGVLRHYVANNEDKQCCEGVIDLRIKVTDTLSAPEGTLVYHDAHKLVYVLSDGAQIRYEGTTGMSYNTAYMRLERRGGITCVQVKPASFGSRSLLKAMEIEHSLSQNFGILLHAAYICVDDKAILFTGPSGVGKSTQARLWCSQRSARLINGDRCAVKASEKGIFVHGVPYCGSSKVNFNRTLPLKAIACLAQAPSSSAIQISGIDAFMKIWGGCCINTWNSDDVIKCTATVTDIVEKTPVILLECTPDITAVDVFENAMKELNL